MLVTAKLIYSTETNDLAIIINDLRSSIEMKKIRIKDQWSRSSIETSSSVKRLQGSNICTVIFFQKLS